MKIFSTILFILLIAFVNPEISKGSALSLNIQAGLCDVQFSPDLPLLPSNSTIEADIKAILDNYLDDYLGTSAPSASALSGAVVQYDKLNIVVSNGILTGVQISSYTSLPFLKTFAQQLRFNPTDEDTREKANNAVQLLTQQVCAGTLKVDGNGYVFEEFAKNAVALYPYLNDKVKGLVDYTLNAHGAFRHFWEPLYDQSYQATNGAINTDVMYNLGTAIMVFAANQPDPDERYRWMRGFQRWVERFASYTYGTADGIKIDGTGFHHWTAYDGYMYALQTACNVIYYLAGSEFQINRENYLFFRNAIYAQIVQSNESGVKALSMVGRNPQSRNINYSSSSVKKLALGGGEILGLSTADPVMAGEYNRIWGVSSDFNYSVKTPLSQSSGFYQLNHANAGIFRNNNWLAVMKGFSSGLWGAELYETSNRYGRYQSYGTLEIIYSGSTNTGNGFDVNTWNWNYNPGTTTIVLPWSSLHGEKARIDEYQKYDFAGALAFKNKNSEVLNKTHGTVGVFAMDFNELENQGFGTVYGPNSHNGSFRFKKSTFAFEDMIICLGSDINNNDTENPTVTTLFQRLDNTFNDVLVNGTIQDLSVTLPADLGNWVMSNYGTGFYVIEGNDEVKLWNGDQQTPNQNQIDPGLYINNATDKYWIGHINHGTNPVDAEYEYLVLPQSDKSTMNRLDAEIKSGSKPYTVHQKNSKAHILEHKSGVWGYAIFSKDSISNNDGLISYVSDPCLIMYEENSVDGRLKMAVSNPAMGFTSRTYKPAVEKVIKVALKGKWVLDEYGNSDIELVYQGQNTELSIKTNDGLPEEFELKWDGPLLKSVKINGAVPFGWDLYKFASDVRLSLNEIPDVQAVPLNSADEVTITLPADIPGEIQIEVGNEEGFSKLYTISISAPMIYVEDFEKLEGTGMMDTYFAGNNNFMWYVNGRLGNYLGSGQSIYFYPEQGGVISDSLPGGISSFSFEAINYRNTTIERIIEVYINDSLIVRQPISGGEKTVVQAEELDFRQNVVLKIVNATDSAQIIAVDNIFWKGYAPDRNAYLAYIKVNGQLLEGFDPIVNMFYLDVPDIQDVEAVAQSKNASVEIEIPQDTTGVIKIHVTAQDGSWNDYEIDFYKAVGISDAYNRSVKLYPNPADQIIYLEGDFPENSTWELISTNGSRFDNGLISPIRTKISLSDVQNGIFLLRVMSGNMMICAEKLVLFDH